MRRVAIVLVLAPALALVLAAPGHARAGDDLSADTGGLDVFGDAADIDPATEARLQAHLSAARNYLDKMLFTEARRELEAADRLVPMHDEVMRLFEEVGAQEDEARTSGKLLQELEAERAGRAAKAQAERERAERANDAVAKALQKHDLPQDLRRAIPALRQKRADAEARLTEAERELDRCIGAAALAHAAAGARRCREGESDIARLRARVKDLDADVTVLELRLRDRHGQKALDALK